MTMDYFLLLCSLLLPVVSAVEGKKSHIRWCYVALQDGLKRIFFLHTKSASTHASTRLDTAAGEAPVSKFFRFIINPELKPRFHFQSGHLAFLEIA